ncbi:ATP-binding protein [Aliarcobacter vitoriensis]|uniref:AAA family ATPase n=1 Tax=Aliarcobacter vitoriensis TaxID=2011099 RepID=A0A366MRM1_9BACT|nr:ATP-binding protein [Aliarcobacter vitoriensis]RBQ28244.1 AAA family ATPase [Aliarcobacter vitoriensis]
MIERKLEKTIIQMLDTFRIVSINGPRQSGKTTLQKKIAKNKNMKYYTFDDIDVFSTANNDPKGFIQYISKDESIALDEVQMIPEIILPIKISVDEQNKKGMFLLTGSSDMFKNSKIKESLAGRMVSFNLYPLSYSEINHRDINIIDKLFSDDFNYFDIDFETISKEEFISAVINGGYPEVYNLPLKTKKAWYDFYIKARITKDIASIENVQIDTLSNLAKLLKILAGQVGSLVNYTNISKSIGIADKTVAKYIKILEALYIVKLVPSYSNNILKQVTKSPKVHFIDSGLASFLLNATIEASMIGKNEHLGNLVETFVYSELIKHQANANEDVEIYHFRDSSQKEVDFVLESNLGDIVAIEVKSGTNIKNENFKGLLTLAKTIKSKNFRGIIFYGGDKVLPYKIEDYQFWLIPLKVLI